MTIFRDSVARFKELLCALFSNSYMACELFFPFFQSRPESDIFDTRKCEILLFSPITNFFKKISETRNKKNCNKKNWIPNQFWNLIPRCQFKILIRNLFPLFLWNDALLMWKSTASCLSYKKTLIFNRMTIKMNEKCFLQTKNYSSRSYLSVMEEDSIFNQAS